MKTKGTQKKTARQILISIPKVLLSSQIPIKKENYAYTFFLKTKERLCGLLKKRKFLKIYADTTLKKKENAFGF
jgi:hypothetical protein